MEKKTSAFAQIPMWLVDELTGNEIKLFLIMYNGWRMMKNLSNGNTYYRSYKKLKEDLGIKSKNNNKVIDAIRHFEELGILRVERNGKKTNHYEFNEFVLFHSNDVPETGTRDVPETGTSKPIDDVPETGILYNSKENIKEYNTGTRDNIPSTGNENNRTVPPDINDIQFWDNPLIYVMELVSFPYDNYWCPLKDFIKQGYFKEVREAISQIEDKALREYLNEDIDNCIQRLKSA